MKFLTKILDANHKNSQLRDSVIENIIKEFPLIKESFLTLYEKLEINQRLYLNGMISLVLGLFFLPLGRDIYLVFLAGFLAFWVLAVLHEGLVLYKWVSSTVLGKGFLILLTSFAVNMAFAISCQTINAIVGVDPTKFPHTIIFLSILVIPFYIFIVSGVAYIFILSLLPFYLMYSMANDSAKRIITAGMHRNDAKIIYAKTTKFIRFFCIIFISILSYNYSKKHLNEYNNFMNLSAKYFILNFETYPVSSCENSKQARVAFLDDGKILIAKKVASESSFEVAKCVEKYQLPTIASKHD